MQVLLHAGIDKAGSTAIQAHLHANRDWLADRGVCVPHSGWTRYGHRKLFLPDQQREPWALLGDELGAARRAGTELAVLSFEGICALPRRQVDQLVGNLQGFDLTFLFYLREQAEVLQSGYLQNLKAAPQAVTVDQLRENPWRLPLKTRDYLRMLAPFRATLGDAGLRLRPFVAGLLEGGDVVDDFLAQLGLSADADFERLSMRQNPSLDLPSARYLNAVDRLPARGERDALVDDLLWIIRRDGPQERWFLEKDAVSALREHYRPSNTSLLKEFVPEVDVAVFFGLSRPAWRQGRADGSEQLESALARLHRWPRWNGSRRAGEALLPMLEGGGWQADGNGKGWTCGQTGVIRFRVPLSRHAQQPRDLLLRLEGVYRDGCRHSQVVLNGRSLGNRSLSQGDISVPADRLGREREVELRLEHNATDSSLEALFRLHTMELVRL